MNIPEKDSKLYYCIESHKVLFLLEACFDMISSPSPSMKIQINGGKITENLGFESLLQKVKFFFFSFSAIFLILHQKTA